MDKSNKETEGVIKSKGGRKMQDRIDSAHKKAGCAKHQKVSLKIWTKETGSKSSSDKVWNDAVAASNVAFKKDINHKPYDS